MCTKRFTTRSSPPSSRRSRDSGWATRWTSPTYIGAITRRPQLDVLKKQVADAKKKGAKLLAGGSVVRGKGNWFEPTVFVDVDHSMTLMKDESFGPIIGIEAVADDEAAVDLMNDTEYGLTAGVYTADPKRARRILGAGAFRHRVLELLRPRESPAAVVGHRPFGDRAHAVHVRHPDVHAAEGLAPAFAMTPRQRPRPSAAGRRAAATGAGAAGA